MVGSRDQMVLLSASAFVAVTLVSAAALLAWAAFRTRARERALSKRLATIGVQALRSAESDAENSLFRKETSKDGDAGRLRRLPMRNHLEEIAAAAGAPLNLPRFATMALVLALIVGFLTLAVTKSMLFAALAAAPASQIPYMLLRRKGSKRLRKFEDQLPDAIDLIGRALRAGHPLPAGLKMVADEMMEPIAGEFRQVFEEQKFGMPLQESLGALATRIPLPDVWIFVTAVLIQREVGGKLSEIMDKIAHTVRERFALRRMVAANTAQGRLSGYVLSALPLGFVSIIMVMNPGFLMPMFTTEVGHMLLGAGLLLQLMGYLLIRKIVNIEV